MSQNAFSFCSLGVVFYLDAFSLYIFFLILYKIQLVCVSAQFYYGMLRNLQIYFFSIVMTDEVHCSRKRSSTRR